MTLSGYVYRCRAGQTFDGIALECYGDEYYAAELLCANPKYSKKLVFDGGEELELPVVNVAYDKNGVALKSAPWKE